MRDTRTGTTRQLVTGAVLFGVVGGCLAACGGSGPTRPASSSTPSTSTPSASTPSASDATPSASATADPQPFRSERYHFTVSFPSAPEEVPIDQQLGTARLTGEGFLVGRDEDGSSVTVLDFPPGTPVDPPAQALQKVLRSGAASGGGTVTASRTETFQGQAAQVLVLAQGGTTVTEEAFLVGQRMYVLLGAPEATFRHLHDSFTLLP